MRILALIADRTFPPITGARVRNHALWPALKRLGVDVRLLGLAQRHPQEAGPPVGPPDIEAQYFPFDRDPLPLRVVNASRYSYHQWPRAKALDERVEQLMRDWRPDVVHAEELRLGAYLPPPSPGKAAPIRTITLHNVESDLVLKTGSVAIAHPALAAWINRWHRHSLKAFEASVVTGVERAFAYSHVDFERLRRLYPAAALATTSNGTSASLINPPAVCPDGRILLFGSLSWQPNIDGIWWFVNQVVPHLSPGLAYTIAGSRAGAGLVAQFRERGIPFVDTPTDLDALYRDHAVVAVPLFDGSGTRTKILEALAYERPVVSTTKGAEGLGLGADSGVLEIDTPMEFAQTLSRLAADVAGRVQLGKVGRQAVLKRYDWSSVAAALVRDWELCLTERLG